MRPPPPPPPPPPQKKKKIKTQKLNQSKIKNKNINGVLGGNHDCQSVTCAMNYGNWSRTTSVARSPSFLPVSVPFFGRSDRWLRRFWRTGYRNYWRHWERKTQSTCFRGGILKRRATLRKEESVYVFWGRVLTETTRDSEKGRISLLGAGYRNNSQHWEKKKQSTCLEDGI